MKPTTIQNWIDGKTSPKVSVAIRITEFFGVTINQLCGFDDITDAHMESIKKRHYEKHGRTKRIEYMSFDSKE